MVDCCCDIVGWHICTHGNSGFPLSFFADRGCQIRVHPFSFAEYCQALDSADKAAAFADYLIWGGMPLAASRRDASQRLGRVSCGVRAKATLLPLNAWREIALRVPVSRRRRPCVRQRVVGSSKGLLRPLQRIAFQDSNARRTRAKHQPCKRRIHRRIRVLQATIRNITTKMKSCLRDSA